MPRDVDPRCPVCKEDAARHHWGDLMCPELSETGPRRAPVTTMKPIPTRDIMSKKGVDDLRDVLFETIASVRKGELPLDKAKVVAELAQVMVNTAKAETDFVKATKGRVHVSKFLGKQDDSLPAIGGDDDKEPKD